MLKLENIASIGAELALAWSDGVETYIQHEDLRKSCPCANCQGEPDALGRVVKPPVHYNAKSFSLVRWENIGGYALAFHWEDGHSTGIFSYEYLRKLGE